MIVQKSTILLKSFVLLIFIKQLEYVLSEKETDPKVKKLDSRIVSILGRHDRLQILKKSKDDTWIVRNSATNLTGYVPSFMIDAPRKYAENDRKIYTALKDSSVASLGLNSTAGFLSYSRGDQFYVIRGEFHERVWYARSLTSQAEGYISRSDVIDQCDTRWLLGRGYINCGDKCVPRSTPCFCCPPEASNSKWCSLIDYSSSFEEYCCVPFTETCEERNHLGKDIVACFNSKVLKLSEPCQDTSTCYKDYKTSQYHFTYQPQSYYTCKSGDKCLPMEEMCNGNGQCGEERDCGEELRCADHRERIVNISSSLIDSHYYCQYPSEHFGTGEYDYIDRSDENVTNPLVVQPISIDYSYLQQCTLDTGNVGVTCYQDSDDVRCLSRLIWCTKGLEDLCQVNNETKLSSTDATLCGNKAFWRDIDANFYLSNDNGQYTAYYGLLCNGWSQHIYLPWYYEAKGKGVSQINFKCDDQSHRIHTANTTCPSEKMYMKIFTDTFCTEDRKAENMCKDPLGHIQNAAVILPSYYQDIHECWDSCAEPGPKCQACVNEEYFLCENSQTCVHGDLVCDGHPQCPNSEDEDFYRCKERWAENKVFPSHATVKCKSMIYPALDIIATPCDNIVECANFSDESLCSDDSIAQIFTAVAVVGVLILYFCLKFHNCIISCLECSTRKKSKKTTVELNISKEEVFRDFQDQHDDPEIIRRINNFLLHILFSQKMEEMKIILIEFYDLLDKIKNNDDAEIYLYLHRNLEPAVTTAIDEAKFPGLKQKLIGFVEKTVRYKFLTKIQDKFTENDNLRKSKTAMITLWKMTSYQVDLVKDTILTISLLVIMGGPVAIYHFPTKFPSTIVLSLAATIVVPLLMSSIQLAIRNPYLILMFMRKTAMRLNRIIMIFICIGLSVFNYALLVFNFEETKEKVVTKAKKLTDATDEEVLELIDECKLLRTQIIKYVQTDLGNNYITSLIINFWKITINLTILFFTLIFQELK